MAITPYENHKTGNILIDETIRNETAKNSISKAEVSDAVAKSMAMIDAIIRTTDNGTISYHAPSSRTSDAWYNLLKTLLENSNNYDTYTLPAVLFQPAANNELTIVVTANNINIFFNGAAIKSGPDTNNIIISQTGSNTKLLSVLYEDSHTVQDLIFDNNNWVTDTYAPKLHASTHELGNIDQIDHNKLNGYTFAEHINWGISGTETIHSDRIVSTTPMAIVRITATDINYYTPTSETPANWFNLLKDLLESGGNYEPAIGDTYVLPAVIMIPNDASIIEITTLNIKVIGEGTTLKRGVSTPAGELIILREDTTIRGITMLDINGYGYTWQENNSILVVGTNIAAQDKASLLAAVASVYAKNGGTVLLSGTFRIDDIEFPKYSNVTIRGIAFGQAKLRMSGGFNIGPYSRWMAYDAGEDFVETPNEGYTGTPYPTGSHRVKVTEAYVENNNIVSGDIISMWAWNNIQDDWDFFPHPKTINTPGQVCRITKISQDTTKLIDPVTSDPKIIGDEVTYITQIEGTYTTHITIEYKDPGIIDQVESIEVNVQEIIVHLATSSSGEITSTATTIANSINNSGPASTLVSAIAAGTEIVKAVSKTELGDNNYYLYFSNYVADSYKTTGGLNPKIRWIDPDDLHKKFQLLNLVFEPADEAVGWNGIDLYSCVDFLIRDIRFDGQQGYVAGTASAIYIQNSVDGVVENVDIGVAGINNKDINGFGIAAGCANIYFKNCKTKNYHHGMTTGGQGTDSYGPIPGTEYRVGGPSFCTFENCVFEVSGLLENPHDNTECVSTHAEGWAIDFVNCDFIMAKPEEFSITTYLLWLRSRSSRVQGCSFYGSSYGIHVSNGPQQILNNHFVGSPVTINGRNTTADDITIRGNLFEGMLTYASSTGTYAGIKVNGDRWIIADNVFIPRESTSSHGGPLIHIRSTTETTNLVITNNTFRNTTNDGGAKEVMLYVDNGTLDPASVVIRGNSIVGFDVDHRYYCSVTTTYDAADWNAAHDSNNWID